MHTSYSCSIKQSSPLISDGIPEDARELLLSSIGDVVLSPAEKPKSGKSKPVKMNAKQKSGYKFSDADGEYDVPIIDEHMWYRVNVRKASEKKLCELFAGPNSALDAKWSKIVIDAYYPQSPYIGFKGKNIELKVKPMIPGLLYLKTKMGPDVADELEKVQGIYGLTKTSDGIVMPLGENEASQLETMKNKERQDLTPDLKRIKKEEYVSVVSGEHTGRYGIVMGAKAGKIEVCLRSEYKDEWDVFNVFDLRYLEKPPEKKWKEMTAKEAVESLMAKDPKSPTIRSLREQGLLEEILYPEGRPPRRPKFDKSDGGRAGGRSVRSIATTKKDSVSETFESFVADMGKNIDSQQPKSSGWNTGAGLKSAQVESEMEDIDSFISDRLKEFDSSSKEQQRTGSFSSKEDDILNSRVDVVDLVQNSDRAQPSQSNALKMEDFDSFEEYLDALVDLEKGSSAPLAPKAPKQSNLENNISGGESGDVSRTNSAKKEKNGLTTEKKKRAISSYSSSEIPKAPKKAAAIDMDDLDEFFKSLE